MRSQIRSLRHKMALAYAEATIHDLCLDFCLEWQANVFRGLDPPESHPFILKLTRAGFDLPTYAGLYNHLERCRQKNEPPHPEGLVNTLLPWTIRL